MRDRRLTRRGDRGAVLIIVSVFAMVAVIMMAFVVDIGGLRSEGKQVTLSTDAAALASVAVIDFRDPNAKGNASCAAVRSTDTTWGLTVESVATHYLTDNSGGVLDGCQIVFGAPGTDSAYLTVTATGSVEYAFGKSIGQNGGTVTGSSSARVAAANRGLLYPVGLCTDGALAALATTPTGSFDPPLASTVVFDPACGGSGNKRQIQFKPGLNGDSCGAVGMWCWDFNHGGYTGGAPQIVESDTGKDWQKAEATIKALAESKTHIWIPAVKSRADLPSSGTKANYEVTHFVEVRIVSYSKRAGLGLTVFRIVPFDAKGPPATSNVYTARVHLCGTGQGVAACDEKTGPPPIYTPDPVLDFRDLCKVTSVTPAAQVVRVDAASKLITPATVTYQVENPANCDPPVALRAVSSVRTAAATPGTRSGNSYPFTFPAGTVMAQDGTIFRLDFSEGGFLADSSATMTILGPCTVSSASVTPGSVGSSGNQLQGPVTVKINLTSAGPCTDLRVQMVERKNNGVVNTILTGYTPTTASFTITLPTGTSTYAHNSDFDVVVSMAGTTLPYAPTASLTTNK